MNYFWSAKHASFFPKACIRDYVDAGWDLSDLIDISDDEFDKYKDVPSGKMRSSDSNGMPCLIDAPPPSQEENITKADTTKSALQREVEDAIKPLERAKQLGIATDAELALLLEWEKYSVFLMRVDTSTAPDITWPQKP